MQPEFLGKDTIRRLLLMLRWWERESKGTAPQAKGPLRSGGGGGGAAIVCQTTTGVGPMSSGTSPGNGTVQPYTFDGTTLTSSGSTITVYNETTSSIATGAWLVCVQVGQYFFVVSVDGCNHLS